MITENWVIIQTLLGTDRLLRPKGGGGGGFGGGTIFSDKKHDGGSIFSGKKHEGGQIL